MNKRKADAFVDPKIGRFYADGRKKRCFRHEPNEAVVAEKQAAAGTFLGFYEFFVAPKPKATRSRVASSSSAGKYDRADDRDYDLASKYGREEVDDDDRAAQPSSSSWSWREVPFCWCGADCKKKSCRLRH